MDPLYQLLVTLVSENLWGKKAEGCWGWEKVLVPSTHYSLDCVEDLHNKKPATLLWACGHWFGVLVPVDGHKALQHMWATGTELRGLLITTKEEVKNRSDD